MCHGAAGCSCRLLNCSGSLMRTLFMQTTFLHTQALGVLSCSFYVSKSIMSGKLFIKRKNDTLRYFQPCPLHLYVANRSHCSHLDFLEVEHLGTKCWLWVSKELIMVEFELITLSVHSVICRGYPYQKCPHCLFISERYSTQTQAI